MTASFGLRAEGVPVRDIIGGDTGFRRPGIAVSVEPAINMIVKGKNAVTLSVRDDQARLAPGESAQLGGLQIRVKSVSPPATELEVVRA